MHLLNLRTMSALPSAPAGIVLHRRGLQCGAADGCSADSKVWSTFVAADPSVLRCVFNAKTVTVFRIHNLLGICLLI